MAACGRGAATVPPSTSPAAARTAVASTDVPAFRHIFLIVMENRSYAQISGNPRAPYINGLAMNYGLATNYYAVGHPSLPNYLALFAGDTFGVDSDCTGCLQNAPNLVDRLEAAGRSWKAYMEDLPAPCSTAVEAHAYALKHDPFFYFNDIRERPERCRRIVPFTQFATDLGGGALPDFVWITPNQVHDMHDGSVQQGDDWLRGVVTGILGSPAWRDGGLVLITWDEGSDNAGCCGHPGGGRVATLALAPGMRAGATTSRPADHYALLRAIEDAWQLQLLARSTAASSAWLSDLLAP